MTHNDDNIRLFIHDCRINLSIGIYDAEIAKPQPVVINIECEARALRRYDDITQKDVTQVIDYEPFYTFLTKDLSRMGHIYFLESAAEHIAAFCLKDSRIDKVRVRIEKTSVFPDAAGAGVELSRTRL